MYNNASTVLLTLILSQASYQQLWSVQWEVSNYAKSLRTSSLLFSIVHIMPCADLHVADDFKIAISIRQA